MKMPFLKIPDDQLSVINSLINNKSYHRPERSKYFVFEVYPEDPRLTRVFDYIKDNRNLYPSVIWIVHDKDVWKEETEEHKIGDSKKTHIHVLFECHSLTTVNGLQRRFGEDLSHVEVCHDPVGYTVYLTHRDYNSLVAEKYIYKTVDICWLGKAYKWFNSAYGQDDSEVMFNDLYALLEMVEKKGIPYTVQAFGKTEIASPYVAERMWKLFSKFQGLIMRTDSARFEIQKFNTLKALYDEQTKDIQDIKERLKDYE